MIKISVTLGINISVFNGEEIAYAIADDTKYLTITEDSVILTIFQKWSFLEYLVISSSGISSYTVTNENGYVSQSPITEVITGTALESTSQEILALLLDTDFGLENLETILNTKSSQASVNIINSIVDGIVTTLTSMALEATLTVIKGSGWSTETLKNIRDVLALETTLTAMKGSGWSTETLKNIRDAIASLNNPSISDIWSYATRTLTNVDNVWSVSTRALTDKANFTLASAEYNNIRKSVCLTGDTAASIGKILFDLNANYTSTRAAYLDYLASGTYGLSALQVLIAARATQTSVDNLNADLGDWSARTNLQSLLTSLGIPDTAGKPLYTVLVTDRLDSATFGLSALNTDLDSIISSLGDGTTGLAAIKAYVDSLETWLGNPSGDTLTTITAKLGNLSVNLATILQTFTAAETGNLAARIGYLQQFIAKGAGTQVAAGKSLVDTILLDPHLDKLMQTASTFKASCTVNSTAN